MMGNICENSSAEKKLISNHFSFKTITNLAMLSQGCVEREIHVRECMSKGNFINLIPSVMIFQIFLFHSYKFS